MSKRTAAAAPAPRPRSSKARTGPARPHPRARPAILCRPDLVNGMPIFRDSLALAAEMPRARFQEKEKPNFLPIIIILKEALAKLSVDNNGHPEAKNFLYAEG